MKEVDLGLGTAAHLRPLDQRVFHHLSLWRNRATLMVMARSTYVPASAIPQERVRCPTCKRDDAIVRNGTRASGVQRYLCKACGRSFTDAADSPFGRLQGDPVDILLGAHAILVDQVPIQYVADDYGVSWATARRWAEHVAADPALLKDATRLAEGLKADVEAIHELIEVAALLDLVTPEEARRLRGTEELDVAERRRRLHELSIVLTTARETRDLMTEVRTVLRKQEQARQERQRP